MVTRVTKSHHAVPKRDVDRLFEELVDDATISIPPKTLTRLRGMVYANTFIAETPIESKAPPAAPPVRRRSAG